MNGETVCQCSDFEPLNKITVNDPLCKQIQDLPGKSICRLIYLTPPTTSSVCWRIFRQSCKFYFGILNYSDLNPLLLAGQSIAQKTKILRCLPKWFSAYQIGRSRVSLSLKAPPLVCPKARTRIIYLSALVIRVNKRELVLPSGPSSFSPTDEPSAARRVTMVSKLSEVRSMATWSPAVKFTV